MEDLVHTWTKEPITDIPTGIIMFHPVKWDLSANGSTHWFSPINGQKLVKCEHLPLLPCNPKIIVWISVCFYVWTDPLSFLQTEPLRVQIKVQGTQLQKQKLTSSLRMRLSVYICHCCVEKQQIDSFIYFAAIRKAYQNMTSRSWRNVACCLLDVTVLNKLVNWPPNYAKTVISPSLTPPPPFNG